MPSRSKLASLSFSFSASAMPVVANCNISYCVCVLTSLTSIYLFQSFEKVCKLFPIWMNGNNIYIDTSQNVSDMSSGK